MYPCLLSAAGRATGDATVQGPTTTAYEAERLLALAPLARRGRLACCVWTGGDLRRGSDLRADDLTLPQPTGGRRVAARLATSDPPG